MTRVPIPIELKGAVLPDHDAEEPTFFAALTMGPFFTTEEADNARFMCIKAIAESLQSAGLRIVMAIEHHGVKN